MVGLAIMTFLVQMKKKTGVKDQRSCVLYEVRISYNNPSPLLSIPRILTLTF